MKTASMRGMAQMAVAVLPSYEGGSGGVYGAPPSSGRLFSPHHVSRDMYEYGGDVLCISSSHTASTSNL